MERKDKTEEERVGIQFIGRQDRANLMTCDRLEVITRPLVLLKAGRCLEKPEKGLLAKHFDSNEIEEEVR